MKTLFLKNGMPLAVAVLAIAGAFATTSMQSAEAKDTAAIQLGYFPDSNGQCSENSIQCSDVPKPQLCRVNGTTGAVAYERDEDDNTCVQPLYRIVNGQ